MNLRTISQYPCKKHKTTEYICYKYDIIQSTEILMFLDMQR